jgi:hypothetical protein
MRRIKPDEVIAAYKQKALKAETCTLEPGSREACCGLGALLAVKGIVNPNKMSYMQIADELGVEDDYYVRGFTAGFDSGMKGNDQYQPESYLRGKHDGNDVRQAVFAASLWHNDSDELSYGK